jgi:hypothetical protein
MLQELKQKLQTLLEKKSNIEAVRGIFGDDIVSSELKAVEEKIQECVHEIEINGGIVQIGKDNRITIANEIRHYTYTLTDKSPESLLKIYYRGLASRCSQLPLLNIDSESTAHAELTRVTLPDVFVPLRVKLFTDRERGDEHALLRFILEETQEDRCLLEVIADPEQCLSVLLGEAGSGKTAFTRTGSHTQEPGQACVIALIIQ